MYPLLIITTKRRFVKPKFGGNMRDKAAYDREWRKANPEKFKASVKRWRASNPEKMKEYNHRAYLKRKEQKEKEQSDGA